MIAVSLALVEMGSIFAAVCAMVIVWLRPWAVRPLELAAVVTQAFALSLFCVVVFYFNNLYDLRTVPSFAQFVWRLARSIGVVLILVVGACLFLPDRLIGEGLFVWSGLLSVGLVLPLRAVSYAVIRSRPFRERVLILGTTPLAHQLIDEIEAHPDGRIVIVGVADDAMAGDGLRLSGRLLGPLEHLDKIIKEVRPDRIIVALADRRGRLPVDHLLQARADGIIVEEGVEVSERLTGKMALESLTPSSLIFCQGFRKSQVAAVVARGLSLLASVVALVGLAPVIALIAVAIKLASPGPVFIVQDRVGLRGKRFKLIKFRTMHPVDGETPLWFRDSYDRITPVGKWLRKFRLDELPQFVNILRGDMNLVGPRPHRVPKFELFAETIPYFWLRSVVRPGLTGWAQVRYGYAGNPEEEIEKIRYDMYYIKHMSLWLDLRILFETVQFVLLRRGARTLSQTETRPERAEAELKPAA